jgi:anti-sigma-K factor RskA
MSEHDRWVDAAGAYVLEAMPEDEREAFERHLDDCAACREEVADLLPAAHALPMASPQMTPPPELKARIMAEVEREAALLAQAGEPADRPPPAAEARPRRGRERRGWLSGWRLAPVAAALLVAGVLAGTALDRDPSGPGEPAARTVAVTVDRDRAPDGSAELRLSGGEAMLVGRGMPAPPEGRVYQVWVMPEGSNTPQPTDVLFSPRSDGSVMAAIPNVDNAKMVLVTDEPMGGSDEPSRTPVMTASPS